MSFFTRFRFETAAAWLTAAAVGAVLLFLLFSVWPLLVSGEILGTLRGGWRPFAAEPSYGIGPMVLVSLLMAGGAVLLAFPLAVGVAMFIHGTGSRRLRGPVQALVAFLTGVPTVVYGFVAVILLVPMMRHLDAGTTGYGLLPAILTLALLILPTMILVLDARLGRQDRLWMQTGLALGMSPGQTLQHVLLPQARGGLVTAMVLGLNRALGDTLVALMVAGNAARLPEGFLDSVRSLTAHIALVLATDTFSPEYRSVAAAALVLFLLTSGLTLGIRYLASSGESA